MCIFVQQHGLRKIGLSTRSAQPRHIGTRRASPRRVEARDEAVASAMRLAAWHAP